MAKLNSGTRIYGTATVDSTLTASGIAVTGTLSVSGAVTLTTALPVASGGTGTNASTGTGSVVLATSPTLVTPLLGTPTSGTLTNCTSIPGAQINTNTVANASLAQMANGTVKGNISGPTANAADVALSSLLRSYLSGLTISAAGSTGTFGVAVGVAMDSTNANMMTLASAYTKTTGSWTLGTGNGGLDTGTIANATWYHAYLIQRVDTGVTDILFSLSASSPTLPTSYTLFRRIGSMLTNGSAQWVKFTQTGDIFMWASPVLDVAVSNLGATPTLYTLTVAPGQKVQAILNFDFTNPSLSWCGMYSPDLGTQTAVAIGTMLVLPGTTQTASINILTNTSGQIYGVCQNASTTLSVRTLGYIDRRGRDS